MKKMKLRANATEINKTPTAVRYLWVINHESGGVTTCMTYQTLDKVNQADVRMVRAVDLSFNAIRVLNPRKLEGLKEAWRNNYFNWHWDIPEEFQLNSSTCECQ